MKMKDIDVKIVNETTASSVATVVAPVGGIVSRNNTFKNALDSNTNLMGGPTKKKKKKKTVSEAKEKSSLDILQGIDTSSSQWKKTKKGAIKTDELMALQKILNDLGFNTGKPDGWFGKNTARGVKKFQKAHGLTVDGDPGKNTIGKMISVLSKDAKKDDEIKTTYLDKDGKDTGIPAKLRGKAHTGGTSYDYGVDKIAYDVGKAIDASDGPKYSAMQGPKAKFTDIVSAMSSANAGKVNIGDIVLIDGEPAEVKQTMGMAYFVKPGTTIPIK